MFVDVAGTTMPMAAMAQAVVGASSFTRYRYACRHRTRLHCSSQGGQGSVAVGKTSGWKSRCCRSELSPAVLQRRSLHLTRELGVRLPGGSQPLQFQLHRFKRDGEDLSWRISGQVDATQDSGEGLRWWEKGGGPNMRDIHSTEDFVGALSDAGEKLVVVEFFATWCGSCRALFPKFCKLAAEHTDVEFLKVNFDENKPMCKSLNIKVLPFFHLYRGAEGRLDSFSCSLSKLQKLRDAIAMHNTDRCSLGGPLGVGDLQFSGNSRANMSDQPATAGSSQ